MSTTEQDQADAVVEPLTAPEGATPEQQMIVALANAQAEFPRITKGNTAEVTSQKGSYSYTYADLSDVLAAVRPVLARNGIALFQRTEHRDSGVFLVTELLHVSGAKLTSEVALGQNPSSPQAFGGALTYLRRYELTTMLGIAAEDDTDAQHVPAGGGREPAPAPLPAWAGLLDPDTPNGKAVKRSMIALAGDTPGAAEVFADFMQTTGGGIPHGFGAVIVKLAGVRAAVEAAAGQDADAEAGDAPPAEPEVDAEPQDGPPLVCLCEGGDVRLDCPIHGDVAREGVRDAAAEGGAA